MKVSKPDKSFATCYHGGSFCDWSEAALHAGSLALRYALSVFEGIRLYRQADGSTVKAFALDAHVARMETSLQLTRLPDPGVRRLPGIIDELVRLNRIEEDCYVRPSVSAYGLGEMSAEAKTCLTVVVSRMGRKKWLAEDVRMKVGVSRWERASDRVFPYAAKNISSYAGPRLALLDAKDRGFDNAILLGPEGFLCEAPTAAVFLVKDGAVKTPRLEDGCLPSITRRTLLDLCGEIGIRASEERLTPADLAGSDEAFLCGTGLEIAPIGEVGGAKLRDRESIPVTRRLIEAYFALARGEARAVQGPAQPRSVAVMEGGAS